MLRKDYNFLIFIKCFLFLINSIFGQYCSIVVTGDTCEISLPKVKEVELKVFTINTKDNDGYKRFIYTAKNFGIEIQTIDHDLIYEDENDKENKISFLREIIRPFKNNKNILILFTDSYNTIFANGPEKIIKDFLNTKTNILFGTDNYHFVGHRLSRHYYEDDILEEKLLNPKMFIGYAPDIYKMLDDYDLEDEKHVDDVYYTKLFLNENSRMEYGIQIDVQSRIFQNLYGELQNLKFRIDNDTLEGSLRNIKYRTTPSIIHGDGPSAIELNSFANYLGGTFKNGTCVICEKNLVTYTEDTLPIVSLSLFVEKALPFFEEFLDGIKTINYPKDRIHVFIHSNYHYHERDVEIFVNNTRDHYKSLKLISTCDKVDETEARKLSVTEAIQKKSEFLFSVDSDVRIDDPNILKDLLKYNKTFIGPIVKQQNCNYSNFWGDISRNGFYAKSHDYLDIVNGKRKGLWNVPFVNMIYLVHKSAFDKMNFDHMKFDPDMALCESLRREGIFMYVINTKNYGHLINGEDYDLSLTRPEFYLLDSNQIDWEKRYIQPNFYEQLNPNYTQKQPCPDVYWFHVTTERFCKDLIAIMEAFGKWSDGSHYDPRLEGGYEAVPTRDIHMNQVGLQEMWLYFLKTYVKPLKDLVYNDSDNNDPYTDMNFVVRYRPDEQAYLRPHFDTSTYTINIALNTAGIDFQGGGCRFLRYNCSVTDTKMGWMLMHPGKLTHLHEGLLVTNGTRYIMVSFVDPYG